MRCPGGVLDDVLEYWLELYPQSPAIEPGTLTYLDALEFYCATADSTRRPLSEKPQHEIDALVQRLTGMLFAEYGTTLRATAFLQDYRASIPAGAHVTDDGIRRAMQVHVRDCGECFGRYESFIHQKDQMYRECGLLEESGKRKDVNLTNDAMLLDFGLKGRPFW